MNWRTIAWASAGVALVGGAILYPRISAAGEKKPDEDDDSGEDAETEADTETNTDGDGDDATSDPPPIGDSRWGKGVPTDFQKLVTRTQSIAQVPYLWVMLTIVAKGESDFVTTAHNDDESEIEKGSRPGIERGIGRGNPPPKFVEQIKGFGSGGLFGALASSFAWIGIDKSFMPFLKRKPELMFDPEASAVFAAHYFWRVTLPFYANGRKLSFFDVRTGWASPDALKNNPTGATAQKVRTNMLEDIQKLGMDPAWVESLPVERSKYPGIKVVAKHFGFDTSQEDDK